VTAGAPAELVDRVPAELAGALLGDVALLLEGLEPSAEVLVLLGEVAGLLEPVEAPGQNAPAKYAIAMQPMKAMKISDTVTTIV
jgi:hypothetical protein